MNTGWSRLALDSTCELSLPPIQQGQALPGVAGFVGQVVGPAAIGIDVVEMLPQFAGGANRLATVKFS